MTAKYDIVIIGGGMVGLLLACALGDSPLKIAVIEQKQMPPPDEPYDLRVSAITLASQRVFRAVGAWAAMESKRVSPIREMRVWDAGGTGSIHFDCADIGEPCLGYIIENNVMQAALLNRLQQFTNVQYLCPATVSVVDITGDAATVTLADGRTIHCRLLVGADGADSQVRAAVGITTRGGPFHQQGIVATVTTERSHEQTAWQRFLASGPLAFLPLDEERHCSIVWSADDVRAQTLLGLSDEAFIAELQKSFGERLGKILTVSRRAAFPLALVHAQAYAAARVVLVGDAAHLVHPLAGQGVNLGFMDAAVLTEVLLQAVAKRKDIGGEAVLRRYQRWRKGENLAMLTVTGGFKYLFGNDLPGVTTLRNLGLNLTNAVPLIKNFIMRRATGVTGDLPKLARGSVD